MIWSTLFSWLAVLYLKAVFYVLLNAVLYVLLNGCIMYMLNGCIMYMLNGCIKYSVLWLSTHQSHLMLDVRGLNSLKLCIQRYIPLQNQRVLSA